MSQEIISSEVSTQEKYSERLKVIITEGCHVKQEGIFFSMELSNLKELRAKFKKEFGVQLNLRKLKKKCFEGSTSLDNFVERIIQVFFSRDSVQNIFKNTSEGSF